MTRAQLIAAIFGKKSYLCVGLDTDYQRIPKVLWDYEDPIYEFNRLIIEATKDYCVAYKPNLAFYESKGYQGWHSLQKTLTCIPEGMFTIADAKRGDIGNTSRLYAEAFFQKMQFDAVTVAPYMGRDSVMPFLDFPGKWVILLALTSNQGADDFQHQLLSDGLRLYQKVLTTSKNWGNEENMMFVVGATQVGSLAAIRSLVPKHFLLVPGIGAQGGDLETVSKKGFNKDCGILVNASRSILYASSGEDFAEAASREAAAIQSKMAVLLDTIQPEN